jgi:hypothetical protein
MAAALILCVFPAPELARTRSLSLRCLVKLGNSPYFKTDFLVATSSDSLLASIPMRIGDSGG